MAESQNIEYKESWRDEYLKWVCGFANAQGGKIYIGKKDDGTVLGIRDAKKLMEDIPNKIQNKLGIVADVNLLTENGLEYIEIAVNPQAYPVNYDGEYHYRSGGTKQLLRGNALTAFLMTKTGIKWESAPVLNISIDELDKESFDIFRREAIRSGRMSENDFDVSSVELLDKLGLLTEEGKLTRAGALCFYREPEKVIGGCYVKIGMFDGSEILYQDEIRGSLMLIADRVVDFIYLKYLKAKISYYKETRVETYPHARDAVREAVYNALIHCDWSMNVPIQIRVDKETMRVGNCCVLPLGWNIEKLMGQHNSVPFNPKIAGVFYRAGYIESWGRGIQKICDACETLGTEKPEYYVSGSDIMVRFKALQSAIVEELKESKCQSDNSAGALADALALRILDEIRKNPKASQSEMAERLGVARRSVQRKIEELKSLGRLERIGGKRYGHWQINDEGLTG